MNEEQFTNKVKLLGINVTDKELKLLSKYCKFLLEYNEHTNLTAITEASQVYLKHFYDSLCITQAIDFNQVNSLIDIGTGAGFPGIIIKIFFPHIKVTLLDSNNKKIKFIEQLINILELSEIEVVNARAEEYALTNLNKYDVCTARAVAYADIITELCLPFIKDTGSVLLLKGDNVQEFSFLQTHQKDLNIKSLEIFSYSIIADEKRAIVKINKSNLTKKVLSYSQIIKRNKKWTS